MPTQAEREAIFDVLLKRYGRDAKSGKYNLKKLAEKSEGYTGAEIEQVIVGAMFNRFDRDEKEFTQTDLEDEMNSTKPLSETSKEEIDLMRQKAAGRLRVASNSGASTVFQLPGAVGSRTDDSSLRELEVG